MSNGNISLGNLPLFDNKKNSKGENIENKRSRERKTRDNIRKNKRTSFETYYMYDFKRGSFYYLNCQFKSDKLLMNH